jgi:hypothetical protein
MADCIQDLLARDIETLRVDVLKAGVLNAKALQESAEIHVAHLHDVLPASSELQEASFHVMNNVIGFARLLYSQAAIAESERARHAALTAIDRLAAVLGDCESRQAAAS